MSVMRTQNENTLPELETLSADLKDPCYDVRQSAVRRLAEIGDDQAVELLCSALDDSTDGVSIAAARALGRIGNPAAFPALTRALRGHRIVSRPRYQRAVGASLLLFWLAIGLGPIVFDRFLHLEAPGIFACHMLCLFALCVKYVLNNSSLVHRAVSEALAELATRSRSPQAREALRDLQDLGGDVFVEDRRSRAAYRRAAQAIEAATATHRDLPLPHGAMEQREAALPRPVGSNLEASASLPRVAKQEGAVG